MKRQHHSRSTAGTQRRAGVRPTVKELLHPRNRNNAPYDFPALIERYPELGPFVFTNRFGSISIDFASADAVRMLNTVLLRHHYGIRHWAFPADHLCPPIPGRADYLHYLADLLAESNGGTIPRGSTVSVADIGTGATCIYPLLGQAEYGWRFIGSETELASVVSCRSILAANAIPDEQITIRHQPDPKQFFTGIINAGERIDLTMCNPPFHSSFTQATAGTKRKWKNLGTGPSADLNFGGKHHELVYPGGEVAFTTSMATESARFGRQVLWFTTLLSRQTTVPLLVQQLERAGVQEVRTIPMAQGQKKSRFIAWSFLSADARAAWSSERWNSV
ncbi:MAG: 23S rRNA (adenine(1618)-N(6))-methyltransferase RlmF [Bacteroidetes bacterium]|nr:23S rRNA (adenine(1618)-N(6))-methyltransferase RlmF [Bacteroidota bacterium]